LGFLVALSNPVLYVSLSWLWNALPPTVVRNGKGKSNHYAEKASTVRLYLHKMQVLYDVLVVAPLQLVPQNVSDTTVLLPTS